MVSRLAILLLLASTATAAAQPLLPRCGAALDGQVSEGGCVCRHDPGGSLTGRAPGWRWSCDLLRGPGALPPVVPAGPQPPGLPPGFTYVPQNGGANGGNYGGTPAGSPNGY